jgi:hypothetical protein
MSDTDKKLDEIRARHAHEVRWLCTFGAAGLHLTTSSFQSHDDRAFLLAEIERLRARVKELERADRTPRPPEELVGALHDRIHPTSGRLIHSSPIAPPTQEAKP